jgi:autotransporter-associated beta strand protein
MPSKGLVVTLWTIIRCHFARSSEIIGTFQETTGARQSPMEALLSYKSTFWFRRLAIMVVLFVPAVGRPDTDDRWTNPGTGDWGDASNWTDGVPGEKSVAIIQNGGTARISSLPGAVTGPNVDIDELVLGRAGGPRSEVDVSGSKASLLVTDPDGITITNGLLEIQNGALLTNSGVVIGQNGVLDLGAGGVGGTLKVIHNGTVQIDASGVLSFDLTNSITLGAPIMGAGTVLKGGPGTAVLSGNNFYSGGTNLVEGTLLAGSSTAFGTGPIAISSGATLGGTGGGPVALSNQLILNGNATLTSVNTNQGNTSFNGPISSTAGASTNLFIVNESRTGGVAAVAFGGELPNTYNGTTTVASNVELSLDKLPNITAIPGDLVLDGQLLVETMQRLAGNITGNGQVSVGLGATLTLSGINNYRLLNVMGIASVASDSNLGANLLLAGGTLQATSSFTTDRSITLAPSGSVLVAAGHTLTIAGTISNSEAATGTLDFGDSVNTGTVVLTGNGLGSNLALNVDAGRLVVNAQPVGGPSSAAVIAPISVNVASGATLAGAGTLNGPVTIQNGGILSPGDGSAGTLTVGSLSLNSGSVLNYQLGRPNVVGGGVNSLIQANGDLTLAGILNVTNAGGFGEGVYRLFNYSGSLTNNGLALGNIPSGFARDQFFFQTSRAGLVNLVVSAGGFQVQFWNGTSTVGDGVIHGGSGTWNNEATNWVNAAGLDSLPWRQGFAVFAGPQGGAVTLGENVQFGGMQFTTSGYQINSATGQQLNPIGNGIIRVDPGITAAINAPIADVDALTRSGITKTDSGTLILGGNNTYSLGTTVSGGTLVAASNNAFGTGPVTANGANPSGAVTPSVVVNPGVILPNAFFINNGALLENSGVVGSVASQSGVGNILNRMGGQIGTVSLQSGGTLQNEGTVLGAVILAGTGSKLINTGAIQGSVAFGNLANTVQLFTGGAIRGDLNLGTNNGSSIILDGSGTELLSQAVAGTISYAGSLTKQGAGTWRVDKDFNAPVSTNVLAGILSVNKTLSSPMVTVQNGATLSGSGFINGSVTMFGSISPGNSPGTLTTNGNFSQGPSGIFNEEIASATTYDRLVVSGHANLDGTLRLTLLNGFKPAPGDRFTILTATQGISGQFRNVVNSAGQAFQVTYGQGAVVSLTPATIKKAALPVPHLSDGTPDSTTAFLADLTFNSFGSIAGGPAADFGPAGLAAYSGATKSNAVGITFDAGEFNFEGHHGEVYGLPISGQFRINNRVRLDYQIPLQYLSYAGAHLLQAGLIVELPTRLILASENHPWIWDCKPTFYFASSGGKEIIGGAALTNVLCYRWHDKFFTYANYIGAFEGETLVDNDIQFQRGVSQQIMKNGLRVSIPLAKGKWLVETYGVYTQFFQTAAVSSYFTVGAEIGRHLVWNVEGRPMDLGYFSLGFYSDIGNRYSSGHFKVGSGWRF